VVKSLVRFLRSPKLALGLGLGIAAYSILGTLVPQADLDPAKAAAWSSARPSLAGAARVLGLFSAYTSPVFLAAVALMGVCTVLCAWARTHAAARIIARTRGPFPSNEALAKRPGLSAGPVGRSSAADTLAAAESTLRGEGLKVARQGDVVSAVRGTWGAIGSPLFHWSLALLVVVIALGQLTRAEGRVPLPIGERVVESPESYSGRIVQGPLFGGHTGLTLVARDLQETTVVDGVDRGPTAIVGLYRGSMVLAETRVYPNSPLRYGPLLAHPDTWGYAPLFSVETTAGEELTTAYGHIPISDVTSRGAGPGLLDLSGGAIGQARIGFEIPAQGATEGGAVRLSPSMSVSVRRGEEATSAPITLSEGDRMPLFDGMWLRFVKRGSYVQVAVANDWSVPYIYALFALAAIGLSIAVFVRPQGAWVFAAQTADGPVLTAVRRQSRGDPMFEDLLERALEAAVAKVPREGAQRT
jgi:cytochrome c biogenesis protein ResB